MSGLTLSANDSERPKPNATVPHLKPCLPRDTNHIRSDVPLMRNVDSTSPTSALEQGDKGCKYRGNSVRASAFRLVPATTVRASGSVKDVRLKMEVTRNGEHLQPAPPAGQRTASRGQRGNRHPQPNSLLTSI